MENLLATAAVIGGVRWGARLAEMAIALSLQCADGPIGLDCFID